MPRKKPDVQEFVSPRAPEPVGPYPHAKRVGELLFVSGMGPRKRGSDEIPPDFEAQCRSTFENIGFILEEAGSGWDKVVDVTAFLTDIKKDFQTFNCVYAEYLGKARPARTTAEVTRLPTAISIELKVIAIV